MIRLQSCVRTWINVSQAKRLLIGAYFTMEYAFASAALFNPSIVPHPDQSDLDEDSLAVHHEPASDGRRAYFIDRLSDRRDRTRS